MRSVPPLAAETVPVQPGREAEMALRLREVPLTLVEAESLLPCKVAAELGLEPEAIGDWQIVRHGIDARRKPRVLRIYTVEFSVPDE
ncbi:MAG TPA: hypothetical protein VIA07_02535, partial [Desulfuromonadales bacterium]